MTATDAPDSARSLAVVSPVIPAPTTTTSNRRSPSRRGWSPAGGVATPSEGFRSCRVPMREPYPEGPGGPHARTGPRLLLLSPSRFPCDPDEPRLDHDRHKGAHLERTPDRVRRSALRRAPG